MRHPGETEFVQIENVVCNSSPWEARTALAPQHALGLKRSMHGQSSWWLNPAKFASWEVVSVAP